MPNQNSTGLAPQILRPVAAPTDTFANPQAGLQLSRLAASLSNFAPSLYRYSDELAAEQGSKDRMAGENAAEAAVQSGKTYAQAVKDGTIDPHQSPWFRLGAYETFGRVSARSYHDAFDLSLSSTPEGQMMNESTKLDDFNKYERDFRAKWMKENMGDAVDPIMQNSFAKQTDNLIEEQRQRFGAEAGKRLVTQTTDAAHEELFGIVTDAKTKGLSDEALLSQIDLSQKRLRAIGISDGVINRLTASAVAQAATLYGETGDSSILKIMAKIPAGPGGKLLGASYAGEAAIRARDEIGKQTQAKLERDEKVEARAEKVAVNGVFSRFNDAILKASDPSTVDTRGFEKELNAIPGGAKEVETMLRMKDSLISHEYMDDQEKVADLMVGIHGRGPGQFGYTTMSTLNAALGNKEITPSRYHELAADITQRDKDGQEHAGKLLHDPGALALKERNKTMFHAEFGFETQETDWRLVNAETNGMSEYIQWRNGAGANAGDKEINEKVSAIVAKQYNRHASPSDVKEHATVKPNPEQPQGPVPVNPKKTLVTDPASVDSAAQDFRSYVAGGRQGAMSARTIRILRLNNIAPNAAAAAEFFDHQQRVKATSAVPTP